MCAQFLRCADSLRPHGLQPTRFLHPCNSLGKNTGVGGHSFLQEDLPDPGIESGSPALQADSLPSEPPSESQGDRIPKQVTEEGFQSGQFTKLSIGCKGTSQGWAGPRGWQHKEVGQPQGWARQSRDHHGNLQKRALGGRWGGYSPPV